MRQIFTFFGGATTNDFSPVKWENNVNCQNWSIIHLFISNQSNPKSFYFIKSIIYMVIKNLSSVVVAPPKKYNFTA